MDKLGDRQFIYTPDIDTVEGPVFCGVCETQMDVKRNCHGPTSSIMAMVGSKRYYDHFICPHHEENWHEQVVALREDKEKTASSKLAALFEEEIQEILKTRKATKKVSRFW